MNLPLVQGKLGGSVDPTIFYDPVPHVVIKNFLTKKDYNDLFKALEEAKDGFKPGIVVNKNVVSVNNSQKQVLEFKPYDHQDLQASNVLIEIVERVMWSEAVRAVFKQVKDSLFQYHFTVDFSTIIAKEYGQGGHYTWHRDNYKSITGNLWLAQTVVEGGDFWLRAEDGVEKEIKFSDNTCVFFPSECVHKVTPISNDAKRYAVQYFSQRKNT